MLRSVITATLLGILGGFWVALLSDGIEVFQNYVEGEWRYQVAFNSVAPVIVGTVIGALAGANIRFALEPKRVDGLVRGALVGAAVGALLVLAQVVLVVLAANFSDYRVNYQSLLTRFSGIISIAVASGASIGTLTRNRPPAGIMANTVVGTLIGVSFALPVIITVTLIIASEPDVQLVGYFFPLYFMPFLVSPMVGGAVAAVIAAVVGRLTPVHSHDSHDKVVLTAVILGAVAGVTASSTSFFYVIAPQASLVPVMYEFRIVIGLFIGVAVGIASLAVGRRVALRQAQP